MSILRWKFEHVIERRDGDIESDHHIIPNEDGSYVLYADHVAEVEKLRKALAELVEAIVAYQGVPKCCANLAEWDAAANRFHAACASAKKHL